MKQDELLNNFFDFGQTYLLMENSLITVSIVLLALLYAFFKLYKIKPDKLRDNNDNEFPYWTKPVGLIFISLFFIGISYYLFFIPHEIKITSSNTLIIKSVLVSKKLNRDNLSIDIQEGKSTGKTARIYCQITFIKNNRKESYKIFSKTKESTIPCISKLY